MALSRTINPPQNVATLTPEKNEADAKTFITTYIAAMNSNHMAKLNRDNIDKSHSVINLVGTKETDMSLANNNVSESEQQENVEVPKANGGNDVDATQAIADANVEQNTPQNNVVAENDDITEVNNDAGNANVQNADVENNAAQKSGNDNAGVDNNVDQNAVGNDNGGVDNNAAQKSGNDNAGIENNATQNSGNDNNGANA